MGVFPLAATMGDRTSPNWARPGWWQACESHSRLRCPAPRLSAHRLDDFTPTHSAAGQAHLAPRRFAAYIQSIQLSRTPARSPYLAGLRAAAAFERGPPAMAA
jgi:hypothetical protein